MTTMGRPITIAEPRVHGTPRSWRGRLRAMKPTTPARPDEPLAGSPRALGIRGNFAWTACGSLVLALSQWGAVVALAKLLDARAVGEWSLAYAVATPAFLLSDLQLRIVHVTDADRRHELGRFVGLRLLTTLVTGACLLGVVLTRAALGLAALTLLCVCAIKSLESASDLLYAVFQKRERMDLIARSLLLRGPLSLVALVWALVETRQVWLGAAAVALVSLAVLLAHDLPTALHLVPREALRPRWERRALGHLFRLALPLGIVTGLVSLNSSIPRYFLEAFQGPAELGIFSAMSYCVMAGGLLVNALGQSVVARLSRLYSAGDEPGFRGLMMRLVAVGLVLGAAAIAVAYLAGRPVLEILYDPEYAARPGAFVIVVLGGSIGYVSSFLGYGMTAARFFRVQAPLFGALAAVNALTCAVLVPRLGLTGAALATVVTALAGLVLSLAVIHRALRGLQA